MSKILEELAYIFECLEYVNPDPNEYDFDCYNPGLTRQQIDNLIKDLPFKLSEELYDLYRWRNGEIDGGYRNIESVRFLFPDNIFDGSCIPFWRLEQSIANYYDLRDTYRSIDDVDITYRGWGEKWFPIASMENKRILYIVGDLELSPVYLVDNCSLYSPIRVYKSLSSIISAIAECWESELYQVVPDEYGEEGNIQIILDPNRLELERAIYQKYNL
jgi:hypothetical protein